MYCGEKLLSWSLSSSSLKQYKVPGQMHGSNPFYARGYSNYVVRKLECSFIDSVQIVSCIGLVYITLSLIYLNAAALSNLNLFILTLTYIAFSLQTWLYPKPDLLCPGWLWLYLLFCWHHIHTKIQHFYHSDMTYRTKIVWWIIEQYCYDSNLKVLE